MKFHTFLLDKESSDLCVIVTPFGKFKYTRAVMGFLNSPSWAQAAMHEILHHLVEVEVYIDDIAIFGNDFDKHIETINKVLSILQSHNFTVKPSKCYWCCSQAPWLGHILF